MTHVFISYVRENGPVVNRIADTLCSRGIRVWLDRDSIAPGSRWKREIRRAITEGGFFVACFSAEYSSRGRTYMNEELTIAIEELRQRPTDRAWFIPVMLSACQIPDRDIGAGETLRDIQWVELWRDWDSGLERLAKTLLPQRNESHLPPSETSEIGVINDDDYDEEDVRIGIADYIKKLPGFSHTVNYSEVARELGPKVSTEVVKKFFPAEAKKIGYEVKRQGQAKIVIEKDPPDPHPRAIAI